ncbi:hypothetical protein HMSSN036_47340 [Paenibacillus macerans]|nr:hypothetical protein HMSSN036_47340 [Paenibacillus macerans]
MLYPMVTDTRAVLDLNGIWKFKLDPGSGFDEDWQTGLTDAMNMSVPASYNDIGISAEIRHHVGWVWYERDFSFPAALAADRIVLRFGSVTHAAKVYVNGELAAEHKGGFTPFEAQINHLLKKGSNRLTVAVNNIVDATTLPVGTYKEMNVEGKGKVAKNGANFDFLITRGFTVPLNCIRLRIHSLRI